MKDEAPASGEDPARLRDKARDQEAEIRRLHRREVDLSALVERLRDEAQAHEHELSELRDRLAADDVEIRDLRAVRDALTPPDLPRRPGVDCAASFLPATEHLSGDFYLVAEGPHDASVLVVGDVVGKGLAAARRAAFVRTVFATTAPFSDDPARLLSWANAALAERAKEDRDFVTVACVAFSPAERVVRWGYAGHPPMLWLDSGEELRGGRTLPLGITEHLVCTAATEQLTPSRGVLLYTDGVTEARRNGEQFGPTRLSETLHALEGQRPSRIVASLTEEVEQFAENGLSDDLCVVAARVD